MKRSWKKLICTVLALLCLLPTLALVGCDGTPPTNDPKDTATDTQTETESESIGESESVTEAETEDTFVYENNTYKTPDVLDSLKIVGRSTVTNTGVTADWSGSGIEFTARFYGDLKVRVTAQANCIFRVYVDDSEKPFSFTTGIGTRTYTAARSIDKGVHTIRILKETAVESNNSGTFCSIDEITIRGELGPRPADNPLLIEFIGDSITCGVGSLKENVPNAFGSYAYRTASTLGVDYSMVSISGIGLLKSTPRHNGLTMLHAYQHVNIYRTPAQPYAPTRKADLVVINLNTNDKGGMTAEAKDTYLAQARAMINLIKATHGEDVKIVWVFGMMTDYTEGYCDRWATQLLTELGGEAAGYYYTILTKNRAGVANHPNTAGHTLAAEELVSFLRSKGLVD